MSIAAVSTETRSVRASVTSVHLRRVASTAAALLLGSVVVLLAAPATAQETRAAVPAGSPAGATAAASPTPFADTNAAGNAAAGGAAAAPTSALRVQYDAKGLRVTTSLADLFDSALDAKLRSGLASTIAVRVYVARQRDNRPVAVAVRTCKIHYDLWDEVFHVHVASGGAERDLAALTVEAVHRQCAELREFNVPLAAALDPAESYYAAVVAEANPVSADQVEAMRRWAAQPPGQAPQVASEVLFGAFVGLFIRPRLLADRELRRRSRAFAGAQPGTATGGSQ